MEGDGLRSLDLGRLVNDRLVPVFLVPQAKVGRQSLFAALSSIPVA